MLFVPNSLPWRCCFWPFLIASHSYFDFGLCHWDGPFLCYYNLVHNGVLDFRHCTSTSTLLKVLTGSWTIYCFADKPVRVPIEFRQAENYPVDLYYLMDLSNSMEDDKTKLAELGNLIGEHVSVSFPIVVNLNIFIEVYKTRLAELDNHGYWWACFYFFSCGGGISSIFMKDYKTRLAEWGNSIGEPQSLSHCGLILA